MGIPLFGVDIAGIVDQYLSPNIPDATLTKVVPGSRDPDDLGAGMDPTETNYACKAVSDTFRQYQAGGSSSSRADRYVMIVGDSLDEGIVPEAGDKLTVEEDVYEILEVYRDPAAATYRCHVRGGG